MNQGKKFEQRFKTDWENSFPGSFLLRIPDQQSKYAGSKNICDFISFVNNKLFLIECKSHKGASFPLTNLTQYYELSKYSKLTNVYCGVIIWLIDKDVVMYVPISTISKMTKNKKKSISYKDIDDKSVYNIPSKKLRTFMQSDYKIIDELTNGD